jgi:hypothetical protein
MTPLTKEAFKLYWPPFKYQKGYIYDSKGNMVADQAALRVRGWGKISYMKDPEELQDTVGVLFAQALTEFWKKHLPEAIK